MLKLGRREPTNKPALMFKSIFKAMPEHPLAENYLDELSNWQMLGNDQFGDCVAVAWANSRKFFTASLTDTEVYPTQEQVYELYKTQNPNFPSEDEGMVIQYMLDHIRKNGDPTGEKPIAFAKVDVNNLEEVKAAIYIFGGLILGIGVQEGNYSDYNNNMPWDYRSNQQLLGGHAVLAGGYSSDIKNNIRFITWALETGLTDNFWKNLVQYVGGEAWVVIWKENLGTKQFVQGIDVEALAKSFTDLTGEELPLPEPPVPPEPPIPNPGCTSIFLKPAIKLVTYLENKVNKKIRELSNL